MPNADIEHEGKSEFGENEARLKPINAAQQIRRIAVADLDVAVVAPFDQFRVPAAGFEPGCPDPGFLLVDLPAAGQDQQAGRFVFFTDCLIILKNGFPLRFARRKAQIPDEGLAEMAKPKGPKFVGYIKARRPFRDRIDRRP